MNQNYLTGLLVFGFGVLTGVVVMKLMTPAPSAPQGGILENLINKALAANVKGIGRAVPPWQVPETRSPQYNVGAWFAPNDSQRMRGHLADNILTYL